MALLRFSAAVASFALVALTTWLAVRFVNRRERWAKWSLIAALGIVVVGMYPAVYLSVMQPLWTIPYFGGDWERYPVYRISLDDETAQRVFGVAHSIDRRVRPEFWKTRNPYRGGWQP